MAPVPECGAAGSSGDLGGGKEAYVMLSETHLDTSHSAASSVFERWESTYGIQLILSLPWDLIFQTPKFLSQPWQQSIHSGGENNFLSIDGIPFK